jgi:hypothetical protein
MDLSSMPMDSLEPVREDAVALSSQHDGGNDEERGGNEDGQERSLGHGRVVSSDWSD